MENMSQHSYETGQANNVEKRDVAPELTLQRKCIELYAEHTHQPLSLAVPEWCEETPGSPSDKFRNYLKDHSEILKYNVDDTTKVEDVLADSGIFPRSSETDTN
jgi:hypothetical protein